MSNATIKNDAISQLDREATIFLPTPNPPVSQVTTLHTTTRLEWSDECPEFWPKARLASISTDVDVVSASTLWTPTPTSPSSDVDANFSDLHALQSQKFRKQATPTIGELSPTTHYLLRRTGVVGDETLVEETLETDSERGD
ncbi:hypothetical protein Taro_008845 [Colocasia esculenta]|uniref:Uncharacterized protein n=1 Tax=Colocasia esculenta TaxID=4460 RepID=A0A843TUU4_COLES|nr:hypothetical protein [Colocasia esculenta]